MTKRSKPQASKSTTTTTEEITDMTTTEATEATTTPEATEAEAVTITTHDTIEKAVDAFLADDTEAIARTVAILKGGARTAASGRAVQHLLATGADPEKIGAVATAVQEAIEKNRATPAAKATMSAAEATAAEDMLKAWIAYGAELLPFATGLTDLQRSAMVDTLRKIEAKVSVTTGERRTIRYNWSLVKGRKVNLSSGDKKFSGTMSADGKVKVDGSDKFEALSPAAARLLGQKSVRGTQAWTLTDGTPVGDAAEAS